MSADSRSQIRAILNQLASLRDSINKLHETEEETAGALRGHQTVDVEGAFHLVFQRLQDNIVSMEEAIATIAEATGDAPKR